MKVYLIAIMAVLGYVAMAKSAESSDEAVLDARCTEEKEGINNDGFKDPDNCQKYLQCSNGFLYQKDCPPGLVFNPANTQCDWPANVAGCGAPATPEPTTTTTEAPPPPSDSCPGDEGFPYANPDDCSKFFLCSNGVETEMNCPDGLQYNPAGRYCDWPAHVPDCNPPVADSNTTLEQHDICEHETDTVTCTKGRVIQIEDAFYGRDDETTCKKGPIKTSDCRAEDSTDQIKKECNDKNSCTLHASNSVFGDPCYGTFKYIRMTHRCVAP